MKSDIAFHDGKFQPLITKQSIAARRTIKKLESTFNNDSVSKITTSKQYKDYTSTVDDLNSMIKKKQTQR